MVEPYPRKPEAVNAFEGGCEYFAHELLQEFLSHESKYNQPVVSTTNYPPKKEATENESQLKGKSLGVYLTGKLSFASPTSFILFGTNKLS